MIDFNHFDKLEESIKRGAIPPHLGEIIRNFYLSYGEAVQENGYQIEQLQPLLNQFLDLTIEQLRHPFEFAPFHERILTPFNYYQFGIDILRPLVNFPASKLKGAEHLEEIERALAKRENVILLANHQTEPDPQAISLLIEKKHPKLAEHMIFIAGHRVISDPLAVPFSKGRNLLCIFSKRHLAHSPEKKQERLLHNQRAIRRLASLMDEGGKCVYVAPSGGRDRLNENQEVEISPFDPQSIEMFWLMAKQAKQPTHFYPLALATYHLLPPPSSIEMDLGEKRQAHCTPIHIAFGERLDMENFPGSETLTDKKEKRERRAKYIQECVIKDYLNLISK